MGREVEFFFDYGSPASYLAWTQLPGLAKRTGATVRHRPMLLGGVFKATGNSAPGNVPAKGAWMQQDLRRFAARYGVPFARNPHFPVNTLGLMRGAAAAQEDGLLDAYSAAVFPAMWVEGRNMGEPAVLAEVLAAAGIDAARLLARAAEDEVKQALKRTTDEAVGRGVFGAPTFFVGSEMFFGQDRLDFVEEALRR